MTTPKEVLTLKEHLERVRLQIGRGLDHGLAQVALARSYLRRRSEPKAPPLALPRLTEAVDA